MLTFQTPYYSAPETKYSEVLKYFFIFGFFLTFGLGFFDISFCDWWQEGEKRPKIIFPCSALIYRLFTRYWHF